MRKARVLWWNHARARRSQTATGRRRRPSFVEALCLWERNSPQVHVILLPRTPFPVLWHFSFHSFFFFPLFSLRRPVRSDPSESVIFCVQRHFSPRLIFMHTDEAHFPCLLMFYSISNSAPSTLPSSEFRHSNGFKWTHCESSKGF